MNNKCIGRFILAVALATGGASLRAEDDTVTVFGNGLSTNLGASLIIGDTGTNNVLIITNASKVQNTIGILGNQSGADHNSALISGAGSIWSNYITSSALRVGNTGSYNSVVITNGAKLLSGQNDATLSHIGSTSLSSNNSVLVTGPGSSWYVRGGIRIGPGRDNRLTIESGATVTTFSSSATTVIGDTTSPASSIPGRNILTVTGPDSALILGTSGRQTLWVGRMTGHNQLIVSNGASATSGLVLFGQLDDRASTNLAVVTGAGSRWQIDGDLTIQRRYNTLRIEDSGTVAVISNVLLLHSSSERDNMIAINGGNFVVTNAASTARINVIRGTNLISSGNLIADQLVFTNGLASAFVFHGGTVVSKNTSISNTVAFVAGNGVTAAALHLDGGTHSFAHGLIINTNATLMGTGSILGNTTVRGTLAPGNSPGILSTENLTLLSNATYAVDIDGTTVGTDYDQVDVTGFVSLSNSLLSITLGFAPTMGDSFTIINNDGGDGVFGEFAGLTQASEFTLGGGEFKILYNGGTGNDVVLIAVPEPSVIALLALLPMGRLLLRRKA